MRFSIFLCFFLRMRFRRFLISDPMARERLAVQSEWSEPDWFSDSGTWSWLCPEKLLYASLRLR